MNYHHHHLGKSKILERSWKDILGYQQNDRHGWSCHVSLQVDIYTPKPGFVSPELMTQSLQFENMTSTSSHQDPSGSPAPFARGFKEMQGVHVLVGNSALLGFPLQQGESWALCSTGTSTPGQSPPKSVCQDSWLLREADKSDVYNEIWCCVHVLLRRGVSFGLLKSW